mmetsp:Transcript_30028/g.72888  ORF Transcript_30028/g.72888 Transcript_30028/m.72888 type:complete len:140 (+) Transcript_30028:2225-2644(+)
MMPPAGKKGRWMSTFRSRPAVLSKIAAIKGPMPMPIAPKATKYALARVMCLNETHPEIICRLTTSADPKPHNIRPPIAIPILLYEIAKAYKMFPTNAQTVEKINADLIELRVYQNEYKNAANIAAKDDAPIKEAPKAPS